MALNWDTFKKFVIFPLIEWQRWLVNNRHLQARYLEKKIFFVSAAAEMKKKMIFFILVNSIKNPHLRWLPCTQTQDNIFNLQKKLCFSQVSLFPKKVAFFSRAWSLEISRGRLARQAPAYGWGAHRGAQSTRDAVNTGSS